MEYVYKLVCRGARFSYFLLLVFLVPIVCETEYILRIWLKLVPEYASLFLRLTLFGSLMTLLGNSMLTAIMATGNIKKYEFWITIVGCLVFPLTWLAFKLGLPPATTYVIYIAIYFLLNFVRLYFAKTQLDFPVKLYLLDVILRVFVVTSLAFVLPILVTTYLEESFLRLCITCAVSVISTGVIIYSLGLQKAERKKINSKIAIFLCRVKR